MHSPPWTQTEKDNAFAKCRLSLLAWVSNEEVRSLDDEDESGTMLCTYWAKIFESCIEDERHPAYETILEYLQKAPEDIHWTIGRQEFDEMVATTDKVRAWEAKILRLTVRPRFKPDETLIGYQRRTAQSLRKSWKKMGLPLLPEKIASKIWTTMIWAVSMRVMSQFCGLFFPFWGGVRPRGGEAEPPGAWHGTRQTLHVGSIMLGSTTEECSGTH